jgi:hypothetical protein
MKWNGNAHVRPINGIKEVVCRQMFSFLLGDFGVVWFGIEGSWSTVFKFDPCSRGSDLQLALAPDTLFMNVAVLLYVV